jgi:hypothetical protein
MLQNMLYNMCSICGWLHWRLKLCVCGQEAVYYIVFVHKGDELTQRCEADTLQLQSLRLRECCAAFAVAARLVYTTNSSHACHSLPSSPNEWAANGSKWQAQPRSLNFHTLVILFQDIIGLCLD